MQTEHHFVDVPHTHHRLHLMRWHVGEGGRPVLLIHGSIEDGRIFYSKSGKGFAPWLAAQGFDVFVADLRGRGKSTPAIGPTVDFGNMDLVNTDIGLYVNSIRQTTGRTDLIVGSHSWGGVLVHAWYARYPYLADVKGIFHFGAKRRITVFNAEKLYKLNFGWYFLGGLAVLLKGYLPAKALKMGSDNESRGTYRDINSWLKEKTWVDTTDGFDYAAAMQKVGCPPVLSLSGAADHVLGHPTDCQNLLAEVNSHRPEFRLVGHATGHKHNYDHINLVTHKDGPADHFQYILAWADSL